MNARIKTIYKLKDDYQEIFVGKNFSTSVQYEELLLSSRTINKDYFENLYVLEPHKVYKIKFTIDEDIEDTQAIQINPKLIEAGLIKKSFDVSHCVATFYNASDNTIFIEKGAILGQVLIDL